MDSGSGNPSSRFLCVSIKKKKNLRKKAKDPVNLNLKRSSMITVTSF